VQQKNGLILKIAKDLNEPPEEEGLVAGGARYGSDEE
jgi:hypothetical protein